MLASRMSNTDFPCRRTGNSEALPKCRILSTRTDRKSLQQSPSSVGFRKIPRRKHRPGLLHTIPSSWNSMFSYLECLQFRKIDLNLHWTDRSRNQWSDGDGQQIGWNRNGLLINSFSAFATHTDTTQKDCHFGWMGNFGAECKFHGSGVLAWHYRSCMNRLRLAEYVRMLLALRLLRFQPRQSTCMRRRFVHNRHNQFATRFRGQIDGQFSTDLFHMLRHDEIHWNFSAFDFDGDFFNRQFTNVQQLCDGNENGFEIDICNNMLNSQTEVAMHSTAISMSRQYRSHTVLTICSISFATISKCNNTSPLIISLAKSTFQNRST